MTTITEQNKLIAEFMGYTRIDKHYIRERIEEKSDVFAFTESDLKFHTSFDWSIPLYLKFKTLPVKEYLRPEHFEYVDMAEHYLTSGDAAYFAEALVKGITWYNENK